MTMGEFPPVAAWRQVDSREGYEVLFTERDEDGYRFKGVTTGAQDGVAWGLRYEIWVDGALVKTVDNFASAPALVTRTIDGLPLGNHTLRIVVLGTARPAADGTEVAVDGFTVLP